MNKSGLILKLKETGALSRNSAEEIVDTFFDLLTDAVGKGSRVEIRGFGSFSVKKYRSYSGRNPKTGETIHVSAKKLPFFKVGKDLKETVNDK